MTRTRLAVLASLAGAAFPSAAAAHVQVSPSQAAPGDPVLFQLLVPNERTQRTTEVALQIPKGVLVFSVEGSAGWTRTNENAADGSVGVIRWKGRLAKDGFARFAFLASTPEKTGTLAWKAVQTYDDGKATRWIGDKDAEEPAAFTTISTNAPRQNAGGEGAAEASATAESMAAAPAAVVAEATPAADSGIDRDPLALAIGGGGLVLGAAALLLTLRRRPTA